MGLQNTICSVVNFPGNLKRLHQSSETLLAYSLDVLARLDPLPASRSHEHGSKVMRMFEGKCDKMSSDLEQDLTASPGFACSSFTSATSCANVWRQISASIENSSGK